MSTQELWNHRTTVAEYPRDSRQSRVRRLRLTTLTLCVGLAAALAASPILAKNDYNRKNAKGNQLIVSASPDDVDDIAAQYGLTISGEVEGSLEGTQLEGTTYAALLESPSLSAAQLEALLADDPRVLSTSRVELATLPATYDIEPAVESLLADLTKPGDFTTPCLDQGFGGLLWSGYADQEAVRQINVHEAHLANGDCGTAVVAIIDTGVDPDHPLLQGALIDGYDFILETSGVPSEWTNLDLSTAAIIEERMMGIVEQSQDEVLRGNGIARLDLSTAAIIESTVQTDFQEDGVPYYFGHGTMVSGLVRLTAPGAWIMPLKVFDGNGQAHILDIIRAIYYAVDHGADVINMSFSVRQNSNALLRAIQYARHHGVVCVAAAGNQGDNSQIYPAAYPDVIAVAALDGDELTSFSNYGSNLVSLGAPGVGVVSAFPGGLYGAGWGTSFSAPLVSGTAAMLMHRYPEKSIAAVQAMENDLRQGSVQIDELTGLIGSGRLDAFGTVTEAQN